MEQLRNLSTGVTALQELLPQKWLPPYTPQVENKQSIRLFYAKSTPQISHGSGFWPSQATSQAGLSVHFFTTVSVQLSPLGSRDKLSLSPVRKARLP